MTLDEHTARLRAWRALPRDVQAAHFAGAAPTPANLAAVARCPYRGGELPVSAYPPGCCTGATRFACGLGKGSTPGQVTTPDCIECVSPTR